MKIRKTIKYVDPEGEIQTIDCPKEGIVDISLNETTGIIKVQFDDGFSFIKSDKVIYNEFHTE